MAMRARFPGICKACNKPIELGMHITWSRQHRGKAYHFNCGNVWAVPTDKVSTESLETASSTIAETQENEPQHADGMPESDLGLQIANAVSPFLKTPIDESRINSLVDARVKKTEDSLLQLIAETSKSLAKTLTIDVIQLDGKIVTLESAHELMPKLLYLLQKRQHVYLYSGPGSGKSYAGMQAAKALSLPYYHISVNPQTPDSRLMGFIDANGIYRRTGFREAYENGGVFGFAEADNSNAGLMVTLNTALENGTCAFPDKIIERHKDFVVCADGNTCGRGANPLFPERRPFDSAFTERFTFIEWSYDTNLEKQITLSINPDATRWLAWVKKVRDYCHTNYPKLLATPRASFKGAEYLKDSGWPIEQIAECVVFKGIDRDTKTSVLRECPLPK